MITIGTGCGKAVSHRRGPCHLVKVNEHSILLDCGEGASGYLRYLNELVNLDLIIITHLHADHISGIITLIQNVRMENRSKPLSIYLPVEGLSALNTILHAVYLNQGESDKSTYNLSFFPILKGTVNLTSDVKVNLWENDHFVNDHLKDYQNRMSYGVSVVSGDRNLVYSGDLTRIDFLKSHTSRDCLLLCEVTHLSSWDIYDFTKKQKLKQVVLTHINSDKEKEIIDFFSTHKEIQVAKDGDKFYW